MTARHVSQFILALGLCMSMAATAVQIGGPVGPRDPPPPGPTYTARTYYKIVIIPGTAANNWTPTTINSYTTSTTSESTCASAFAAHQAYIASHGYIYANYRTCT
jgi:hypothetical protein